MQDPRRLELLDRAPARALEPLALPAARCVPSLAPSRRELTRCPAALDAGKMLGGSSAMNAQIYQHCSREDYDAVRSLSARARQGCR